jgi:hypothetical protein
VVVLISKAFYYLKDLLVVNLLNYDHIENTNLVLTEILTNHLRQEYNKLRIVLDFHIQVYLN